MSDYIILSLVILARHRSEKISIETLLIVLMLCWVLLLLKLWFCLLMCIGGEWSSGALLLTSPNARCSLQVQSLVQMHIPTCMPYRLRTEALRARDIRGMWKLQLRQSNTGRQKHSPNSYAVLQANTGKHHVAKQPGNKSKLQNEVNHEGSLAQYSQVRWHNISYSYDVIVERLTNSKTQRIKWLIEDIYSNEM